MWPHISLCQSGSVSGNLERFYRLWRISNHPPANPELNLNTDPNSSQHSPGQPPEDPPGAAMGRYMVIGFWLLLLAFGTFGASRWLERAQNLNASVSTQILDGRKFVQLKGDRWGHYSVTVQINGQPVKALVDTGATSVSLTSDVARRLGLSSRQESIAITAAGPVTVYDINLDQVTLGDLRQKDVFAHINPHMSGDEILLGMSFLRHFDMVIRGDILTLREP